VRGAGESAGMAGCVCVALVVDSREEEAEADETEDETEAVVPRVDPVWRLDHDECVVDHVILHLLSTSHGWSWGRAGWGRRNSPSSTPIGRYACTSGCETR
jgi:hypothetical protein